jgi:hypothetical protein
MRPKISALHGRGPETEKGRSVMAMSRDAALEASERQEKLTHLHDAILDKLGILSLRINDMGLSFQIHG